MQKKDLVQNPQVAMDSVRPLGRKLARELTAEEMAKIAGGRDMHTHATGANGDDPADPGFTS